MYTFLPTQRVSLLYPPHIHQWLEKSFITGFLFDTCQAAPFQLISFGFAKVLLKSACLPKCCDIHETSWNTMSINVQYSSHIPSKQNMSSRWFMIILVPLQCLSWPPEFTNTGLSYPYSLVQNQFGGLQRLINLHFRPVAKITQKMFPGIRHCAGCWMLLT